MIECANHTSCLLPLERRAALLSLYFRAIGLSNRECGAFPNLVQLDAPPSETELYPALWFGIQSGILPAIDNDSVSIRLLSAYGDNVEKSEIISRVVNELINECVDRSVTLCLIKGSAVSRDYYSHPYLRPMSDIDVLVHPEQMSEMDDIVINKGAIRVPSAARHHRWLLPDADMALEVHDALINLSSPIQRIFMSHTPISNIPWQNLIRMDDGSYRLPRAFARVYGSLHALREGYMSLKWLADDVFLSSGNTTGAAVGSVGGCPPGPPGTVHPHDLANQSGSGSSRIARNAVILTGMVKEYLLNNISTDGVFWNWLIRRCAVGCWNRTTRMGAVLACSILSDPSISRGDIQDRAT